MATGDHLTPAWRPGYSRLDCTRLENDFGLCMPGWQPCLPRMPEMLALKTTGC